VYLHENILLRFNLTEERAVGLTLMMDFSKVHVTPLGPRSFPLSGLKICASREAGVRPQHLRQQTPRPSTESRDRNTQLPPAGVGRSEVRVPQPQ
jgi:hypothetical protein